MVPVRDDEESGRYSSRFRHDRSTFPDFPASISIDRVHVKIMKRLFLSAILCLSVISTFGQTSNIVKQDLSQADIDRIVMKFTQNEGLFREALNVYAFNRYVTVSNIGLGGQITGTYRRDSFMTFDSTGKRYERILFAPISTLTEMSITVEDIDNMGGIDAFGVEPKTIDLYKFTYLGKERVDELDLYVFDVEPKVLPDWKKGEGKYFQGRVWIDQEDLMIVKSKGKAVPEKKQRFATMESIRENVDGKYWFPSHVSANDELVFSSGQVVKIRILVKFKNYRVGRTDVKILDGEDAVEPQPTPSPEPVKKPLNF